PGSGRGRYFMFLNAHPGTGLRNPYRSFGSPPVKTNAEIARPAGAPELGTADPTAAITPRFIRPYERGIRLPCRSRLRIRMPSEIAETPPIMNQKKPDRSAFWSPLMDIHQPSRT